MVMVMVMLLPFGVVVATHPTGLPLLVLVLMVMVMVVVVAAVRPALVPILMMVVVVVVLLLLVGQELRVDLLLDPLQVKAPDAQDVVEVHLGPLAPGDARHPVDVPDLGLDPSQVRRGDQVGLVEDDTVGVGDLFDRLVHPVVLPARGASKRSWNGSPGLGPRPPGPT